MNTLIENYSIWEVIQSIKEKETKLEDWKKTLDPKFYEALKNSFDSNISFSSWRPNTNRHE